MASTDRTTGAASANITTTERDTANGYFYAGGIIYASHINYLRDMINKVVNHTHSIRDYYKMHTYGNTDGDGYNDDTSSGPTGGWRTGFGAYVGNTITADDHNSLAGALNSVQSHSHSWTDD